MDFAPPRTLCLSSVAQTLSQTSRLKPDRVAGDQDVGWQSKARVTHSLLRFWVVLNGDVWE